MPGAHGPFVEPGWPNYAQHPDIAEGLMSGANWALNAAQIQSNANLRKQQLENELAQHVLTIKEHQEDRKLREKEFQVRSDQIATAAEHRGYALDIAANRLRRLNDRDKSQEQAKDALAQIPVDMENEGWVKGQGGYMAELNRRAAKYIGKLPNPVYNKWMAMQEDDHKGSATLQLQNFKVQAKQFEDDLSRIAFHGSLQTDLQPILHAQDLPDEPTPDAGWNWSVLPYLNIPYPSSRKQGKSSTNKMVPFYDSQGNKHEAPVPFKDLQNLKTRYDDLKKLQGSIATPGSPSASVPTPSGSPIAQGYGVSPQMQADIQRAKDAIAAGKDRNAVIQRLQQAYPGKNFDDL